VVAIVGQTARAAMGGAYQQEVDLQSLFRDVAEFLVEVNVPQQLPFAIDRAIRIATGRRAPTAVIIPADVQELPYEAPEHAFKQVPSGPPSSPHATIVPADEDLRRAATVLNEGERVAMLIGHGARTAATEVTRVAELTDAGVAKALLGKDVLPDDLPYVTGSIGLLGTRPSFELMQDCDTLLIVGSNFPYSQFLPPFGSARAIQIDVEPGVLGLRYPAEVTLLGDAKSTLVQLIPMLRDRRNTGWRADVEAQVERWWDLMGRQAMLSADPVNPMRVVHELSARLPDRSIVTVDSGSAANWYARNLRLREGMRGSLSGALATMGCAVPYAIGAKFAEPTRPVIALVGDGAMQMNGLAELITLARYRERWSNPCCVICVFHNGDLAQVTWELRAMGGAPKFEESQALPELSYAAFARSLGLGGIEVDDPERLGSAWDSALAAQGPVVLDVRCDPDVPPIPPHVSFDQIKSLTEAVVRGDPNGWHVLAQTVRAKGIEFLSGIM
jgi:pyruvate dehydrogenase (quinone)